MDQHQVIAGASGDRTLAYAASLAAPNGVSILDSLYIVRSMHARICVVLETLLERDHPSTHILDMSGQALTE